MPKNLPPLSDLLAAKISERGSKMPAMSKSSVEDIQQLVAIFPDIDIAYAKMYLQNYTHDRVAAVTEKLMDKNFNNYPRHVHLSVFRV